MELLKTKKSKGIDLPEIEVNQASLKGVVVNHAQHTTEAVDKLYNHLQIALFQLYFAFLYHLYLSTHHILEIPSIEEQQLAYALELEEREGIRFLEHEAVLMDMENIRMETAKNIAYAYECMYRCEKTVSDTQSYFDKHMGTQQQK